MHGLSDIQRMNHELVMSASEAKDGFLRAAESLAKEHRPSVEDLRRVEPDGGVLTSYWDAWDRYALTQAATVHITPESWR